MLYANVAQVRQGFSCTLWVVDHISSSFFCLLLHFTKALFIETKLLNTFRYWRFFVLFFFSFMFCWYSGLKVEKSNTMQCLLISVLIDLTVVAIDWTQIITLGSHSPILKCMSVFQGNTFTPLT